MIARAVFGMCLFVVGCGNLVPSPLTAEAWTHKAGVLCLRIEVVGEGERQGWLPQERQLDWQQTLAAYEEWRTTGTPAGLDPEVSGAVASFEAAWPSAADDPFDVAFRCRQMVAELRSFFHVTTIPSMPVD